MKPITRTIAYKYGTFERVGIFYDETNGFEFKRYWVGNDSIVLREWTPEEYDTVDPCGLHILEEAIGEVPYVRLAYCIEHRRVWVTDMDSHKLFPLHMTVNYGKGKATREEIEEQQNFLSQVEKLNSMLLND